MLTVLYGGYVSLTTPPEPLPEQIEEYLVIEESGGEMGLASDALTPGAFAPDLQLGEPPADVLGASSPAVQTPSANANVAGGTASAELSGAGSAAPSKTFGSSFADLPPNISSAPRSAEMAANAAPTKLPAGAAAPAEVTPRAMNTYPSTDGQFRLPDPSAAGSAFDASKGTPFQSASLQDSGYQLSDQVDPAPPAADAPSADSAANNAPPVTPDMAETPSENRGLINALATADQMYNRGELKEALATLSVFYSLPNMTEAQRSQLLSRLDPLAREVIYSQRHLLEQPHRIAASETLSQVADRYQVPWQLLANINNVEDPVTILPGTELKVVRGPFRAEVDLKREELTVFLGDLYAGRFQIGVGEDPAPEPGTFTVQDKQTERVFYNRSGSPIPADSPENPYGNMWLDLGGSLSIHGSPNTVKPSRNGCISLAADYADDLYGILSQGSSVTIRR
ncbi:LysM peptidoglycan-binding domain-containing protein [Roseiconus nitratireducens]|uniref:LysM peptidoglycan-binding domain-containing protein n=2 Tax=Roseiconus nitratireducens TaxID=2605748 RepID=A0A5M6DDL8_9BACT|nr:LysM peptidoglycan-binding domain-containing protein [Roseiconus nitratireducens]